MRALLITKNELERGLKGPREEMRAPGGFRNTDPLISFKQYPNKSIPIEASTLKAASCRGLASAKMVASESVSLLDSSVTSSSLAIATVSYEKL